MTSDILLSFRYFVFSFFFRLALFCLFVFSHGVISSCRLFCREKTKSRHAKRRNNATRKDDKIKVSNGFFSHGVFFFFFFFFFSLFRAKISSFRVAGFVFSSFHMALFHLFVFLQGVISSFRLFAWCLFVFSRGVFSPRKDEKTK